MGIGICQSKKTSCVGADLKPAYTALSCCQRIGERIDRIFQPVGLVNGNNLKRMAVEPQNIAAPHWPDRAKSIQMPLAARPFV
jgi:hypothetical protein